MNSKNSTCLDEACICGETEDNCECALGFFNPEDSETNPVKQAKCFCEGAFQPGCSALVEWRPDDPEAFQLRLIKKIYRGLRGYWGEGDNGHLSLDLAICPAEALWIAKSLKSRIKRNK